MIVPVIATVILTFPFLLYVVFRDDSLIPSSIQIHELSEEAKAKKPVNPNIPFSRGAAAEAEKHDDTGNLLSLEDIMNPYLDKKSAIFGSVIMAAVLITILVINGVSHKNDAPPVYWITCPGAFVMFCWDMTFGWIHRHRTREIARVGKEEVEAYLVENTVRDQRHSEIEIETDSSEPVVVYPGILRPNINPEMDEKKTRSSPGASSHASSNTAQDQIQRSPEKNPRRTIGKRTREPATLASSMKNAKLWSKETFPTASTVIGLLPFPLVPFAFSMFILVQALVTRGWVPVFAYGWDHWVEKTGTVGAIGGMGFISVLLCNVCLFLWSYFCFHFYLYLYFCSFGCLEMIADEI